MIKRYLSILESLHLISRLFSALNKSWAIISNILLPGAEYSTDKIRLSLEASSCGRIKGQGKGVFFEFDNFSNDAMDNFRRSYKIFSHFLFDRQDSICIILPVEQGQS